LKSLRLCQARNVAGKFTKSFGTIREGQLKPWRPRTLNKKLPRTRAQLKVTGKRGVISKKGGNAGVGAFVKWPGGKKRLGVRGMYRDENN